MVSYGATATSNTSGWALEDVESAIFYGLVPLELLNEPLNESMTREEFAALTVTVWEKETDKNVMLPEVSPFIDTENEYVMKAFQLGIVNGLGNGEYAPLDTLTREVAATMLTRLYSKLTSEEFATTKAKIFQDDKDIRKWAKESVYYMSAKGLFKGNQANEFMPRSFISREQAVVVSMRMVNEIFLNKLNYVPENTYKAGERVGSITEIKNAFRYARYHLLPSISLTMDATLEKNLKDRGSEILTEMVIENLKYSYNPGTKEYKARPKYSMMAEVMYLVANENPDLSRVSSEAQEIQTQLLGIINQLISPEMDYYQREKTIHDYIVKNYLYDTSYGKGEIKNEESHSLSGLLNNGKGVCDGYAQLFTALCWNTKVPCYMVYGDTNSEGHAWNMVNLYGECYHVDVTWNDPIPDRGQSVRYTYFNVTDNFIKSDHEWDKDAYPSCDFVTYSYAKKR